MVNYANAYKELKNLILNDSNDMKVRINALKALDILSFGDLSSLVYDENHVKWFISNGDLEINNTIEETKEIQ